MMSTRKSAAKQSLISLVKISIGALMVLLLSCTSDNENISSVHPAFIETYTLPINVRTNELAEIYVRATAPNGCYTKLKVKMITSPNRNILIHSNAVYQPSGACADAVIEHDTVLYFTPSLDGKYYLQFNESPLPIHLDTIIVHN